jgi:hypothetical protein
MPEPFLKSPYNGFFIWAGITTPSGFASSLCLL